MSPFAPSGPPCHGLKITGRVHPWLLVAASTAPMLVPWLSPGCFFLGFFSLPLVPERLWFVRSSTLVGLFLVRSGDVVVLVSVFLVVLLHAWMILCCCQPEVYLGCLFCGVCLKPTSPQLPFFLDLFNDNSCGAAPLLGPTLFCSADRFNLHQAL